MRRMRSRVGLGMDKREIKRTGRKAREERRVKSLRRKLEGPQREREKIKTILSGRIRRWN